MTFWKVSLGIALVVLAVHLLGIAVVHFGAVSVEAGVYKIFLWVTGIGSLAFFGAAMWGLNRQVKSK